MEEKKCKRCKHPRVMPDPVPKAESKQQSYKQVTVQTIDRFGLVDGTLGVPLPQAEREAAEETHQLEKEVTDLLAIVPETSPEVMDR